MIMGGLVRPEDVPKSPGRAGGSPPPDTGASTDSGYQSTDDKRKAALKEAGMGPALADDLRSIRTTLIKAHAVKSFDAMFDLVTFQFARNSFASLALAPALDIPLRKTAVRPLSRLDDPDFAAWSPGEAMLETHGASLRGDDGPLAWLKADNQWEAFCALSRKEKQALFAAATATTIEPQLSSEHNPRPELESTAERLRINFAKKHSPDCRKLLVSHQPRSRSRDRNRRPRPRVDGDASEDEEGHARPGT